MSTILPRDSERVTRKRLIDPKLKAAGWRVIPFNEEKSLSTYDRCAIEEFPTDNGPADYALCVSGKILGIVEAKKLTLGPQNVLTQAERYSKGAGRNSLNFRGYRVPFLYSTNGEISVKGLNDLKRLVGDEIKKFAPPDMLNSTQKAVQEAYRQSYFKLRDLVSEAEPASKELNAKISQGINLQSLLEKKFPHLESAEEAAKSYAGSRAQAAKQFATRAVVGGIGVTALAHGLHWLSDIVP
jgi:type I restriction enzyme, R subunit